MAGVTTPHTPPPITPPTLICGESSPTLGPRRPHDKRVRRDVRPIARRPRRLLGRRRRGPLLGPALGSRLRRLPAALLPLVHGRHAEHLLQRARPARRPGPRQAARAR